MECSGTECGEEGLKAAHKCTNVHLTSCTFTGNQLDNVSIRQGATATILRSKLSNSAQKSGIAAKGAETTVKLEGCTLEGNAQCGVLADDNASINVKECKSIGNKQTGFKTQNGGKLEVLECSSDGDAVACDGSMVCNNLVVDGDMVEFFLFNGL